MDSLLCDGCLFSQFVTLRKIEDLRVTRKIKIYWNNKNSIVSIISILFVSISPPHIYICIYIYVHTHVCVYMYIDREHLWLEEHRWWHPSPASFFLLFPEEILILFLTALHFFRIGSPSETRRRPYSKGLQPTNPSLKTRHPTYVRPAETELERNCR
jgi:hypothetical protein